SAYRETRWWQLTRTAKPRKPSKANDRLVQEPTRSRQQVLDTGARPGASSSRRFGTVTSGTPSRPCRSIAAADLPERDRASHNADCGPLVWQASRPRRSDPVASRFLDADERQLVAVVVEVQHAATGDGLELAHHPLVRDPLKLDGADHI